MEYIELAFKADKEEFEARIAAHPEVLRVERTPEKPPGDHYMRYQINAFIKATPDRFVQLELSYHNHYKNCTNCSALYRRPPAGLEDVAGRILRAAVVGWELNAPSQREPDADEDEPMATSSSGDE